MSKSIIILGSARSQGETRQIVDTFLAQTKADFVDLNTLNISYFDYEHRNQTDDFIPLAERLLSYDNIILATPIYWYSMSAQLKTFVDRLSDLLKIRKDIGRALKGKNLGVIACSSDERRYEHFDMPFEKTAEYMDMGYLGYVHTWVENDTIPTEAMARIKTFSQKWV